MRSASSCSSPKQLQGNGLVERTIVTVKRIDDGSDVHAELNNRNAVRERYNASSALLTFSRRCNEGDTIHNRCKAWNDIHALHHSGVPCLEIIIFQHNTYDAYIIIFLTTHTIAWNQLPSIAIAAPSLDAFRLRLITI